MAVQLLASVLTDPSIGGLPTYVFIIIAAAVLVLGIIILIAVSKSGTKKAKKKATRIIEETSQPAPDNEEAAPETQDVPVAEIPDVTTTVGENEEVNLSTLPEDSSVGNQTIEEEPKQAQPEPQPVQQQPEPQPVYQQPVYQQPVYQQPAPQPEPQPQPVYQQPEPQPQPVYQQPEPQPVYQQPVYQQPVYQQPAPQPEPQPQPVYQQPEPQPAPAQEAAAAPQPEAVVVAPVKPKRVPPVRKKAEPKAAQPAAPAASSSQPANVTVLFDLPETGGARGKYVIIKDESNAMRPFKFQLKANNGQILYESENYKIKPKTKQIEAFRNTLKNGTYTIDSEKNGTFRYKLFKADGVTLYGVGEGYKSKEAAESAVNSVKYFAENSNILEDSTIEA